MKVEIGDLVRVTTVSGQIYDCIVAKYYPKSKSFCGRFVYGFGEKEKKVKNWDKYGMKNSSVFQRLDECLELKIVSKSTDITDLLGLPRNEFLVKKVTKWDGKCVILAICNNDSKGDSAGWAECKHLADMAKYEHYDKAAEVKAAADLAILQSKLNGLKACFSGEAHVID